MSDDGFPADFKALCASLGIQTYPSTNALGQPDVAIDREGLNKLIALGLLPEDPSDLPGFKGLVEKKRRESDE